MAKWGDIAAEAFLLLAFNWTSAYSQSRPIGIESSKQRQRSQAERSASVDEDGRSGAKH